MKAEIQKYIEMCIIKKKNTSNFQAYMEINRNTNTKKKKEGDLEKEL